MINVIENTFKNFDGKGRRSYKLTDKKGNQFGTISETTDGYFQSRWSVAVYNGKTLGKSRQMSAIGDYDTFGNAVYAAETYAISAGINYSNHKEY